MQRLVHEQNLTRYIDHLEVETDPISRARLQELLIEEEEQFGNARERLEQADMLILKGQARLRRQELLLWKLGNDGDDASLAQRVLDNMLQLVRLLEDRRQVILEHLHDVHPSRHC